MKPVSFLYILFICCAVGSAEKCRKLRMLGCDDDDICGLIEHCDFDCGPFPAIPGGLGSWTTQCTLPGCGGTYSCNSADQTLVGSETNMCLPTGSWENPAPQCKNLVCPTGWEEFGQSCYHVARMKMKWAEAVDFCKAIGGQLAEPNAAENELLKAWLLNLGGAITSAVWIGVTDLVNEDMFVLVSTQELAFTDFKRPQPTNAGSGEHCVTMNNGASFRWNDENCGKTKHALCQTPRIPDPDPE